MTRALGVWWGRRRAGVLHLNPSGDMVFRYDEAWLDDAAARPISVSLPKQAEAFSRRQTRPFFAGLLPDEAQRDAAARALGLSRQNDFGLLEALGGEIAGALTLLPEGEAAPETLPPNNSEPLSDLRLVKLLDALPRRPFLAGAPGLLSVQVEDGLRLSLAGAQQKLPVVLIDGEIALPARGQPTTYILKPEIAALPGTTANEAFAMRLAAAVGLPVAPVEPRRVRDRPFLLVARYDRAPAEEGGVRRLHQEDVCQALGISPEHKYAAEGGPVFSQVFDLLRRHAARPAAAVLRLLDAAVFNVVVGNADAHGKNFSLLYADDGIALAPLYDLLCTAAYPEVHANFAMKIGGCSRLDLFEPGTWAVFAREAGMAAPYVRRRAIEIAELMFAAAPGVASEILASGFDDPSLLPLAELVQARARQMMAITASAGL